MQARQARAGTENHGRLLRAMLPSGRSADRLWWRNDHLAERGRPLGSAIALPVGKNECREQRLGILFRPIMLFAPCQSRSQWGFSGAHGCSAGGRASVGSWLTGPVVNPTIIPREHKQIPARRRCRVRPVCGGLVFLHVGRRGTGAPWPDSCRDGRSGRRGCRLAPDLDAGGVRAAAKDSRRSA